MTKMILLITNKEDVTVDFIVQELQQRKCSYYRLNTEDIPEIVEVRFDISDNNYVLFDTAKLQSINLKDVTSVYFRRPKISNLKFISEISQQERLYLQNELATLIEGIYKSLRNVFWVNNVYRIREAENKIYQLQIAQELGFTIPNSTISNCAESIRVLMEKCQGQCIVKPIRSGNMGNQDGSKVIFTSQIDNGVISAIDRIHSFPVYIQENIHKDCDIRCIVVGREVFAARIDSQSSVSGKTDWRMASEILPHSKIKLPIEIQNKAIEMTRNLGLIYSAIDFVLDKNGNYVFLECNPNGQWAWIETRLGYSISESIVKLFQRNEK